MTDVNFSGLFLQADLQRIAQKTVEKALRQRGNALPCHVTAVSGQIVTVAFDMPQGVPWVLPKITIPKAEGPWGNSPTQIGDVGLTIPADAYLGGISGLGGGQATWRRPANLSALVWVPVAQQSTQITNQNAYLIQGPDGWITQTTQGTTCSIVGNQEGITMTYGNQVVTLNANGLFINGILFGTHEHSGVTTGSSNSGGPVAG